MSEYPQHDKLHEVVDTSQTIGAFVDWLADEKRIYLAHMVKFEDAREQLSTHGIPAIQELLAEFFDIDYDELMNEKDRMLEAIREKG